MTRVMPSPMPIAPTSLEKASGVGSMWGRGDEWSLTVSMSKWTARGIWPARYSASGSRFMVGRYQEPSITTTAGSARRSLSHSVETKGAVVIGILSSPSRLRERREGDAYAAVLLALLLD